MLDTSRSCRRTGCNKPAGASLSFRYATREVWVGDLVTGDDRSRYDLCDGHADTTTVPRGWTRVDQRSPGPAPPPPPPPASLPTPVLLEDEPLLAPAVGATTGDRYARLLDDLRRLAGTRPGEAAARGGAQILSELPIPGKLAVPMSQGLGTAVVVSLSSYVGARRRGGD